MGGDFFMAIIKFIIAVLLLPLISSLVLGFYGHLNVYPIVYEKSFLFGLFFFLFTYIFLYQYFSFYEFGQKMMSGLFKFAAPLNDFLSRVFPFYLIVNFVLFYIFRNFLNLRDYEPFFMFFVGFFSLLHIICVAQELQGKEESFIKPNYYFQILIVLFFVTVILVLSIDLIREKWTFDSFYNDVLKLSKRYYADFFKKILFFK